MRKNKVINLGALICFAFFSLHHAGLAENLSADLDEHLIEINTGFSGADMLLFGTVEGEGELITVITGPPRDMVVRKQKPVMGIWVSGEEKIFQNVPSYYAIAVSDEKALNLPTSIKMRHRIGVQNIFIPPIEGMSDTEYQDYRSALIRNKIAGGSYHETASIIQRRGTHLFRFRTYFPANVPVGTYRVESFIVKDGKITSAQTTPLFISKVGMNSKIYYYAHQYSVQFGLIAILIAFIAGYIAHYVTNRLGYR